MQELESNRGWHWFEKSKKIDKKFNKNIPFFTCVDLREQQDFVLDVIGKNSITIIDGSQDPHNILTIRNSLVNLGYNDKVVFLTSKYDDYSSYSNVFYFPYQLFRSKIFHSIIDINRIRKYKVSCLNRNPLYHKIYTFLKLQQLDKFDDMLISFNNIMPHENKRILTVDHSEVQKIPEQIKIKMNLCLDQKGHWPTLYRQDLTTDNIWDWNHITSNNHPAFTDSYMNIITETTPDIYCFSEKTFKPLISGQLFTFSTASKSLDIIKKLGFEIFDKDINPYYDSIEDLYIRIDTMIELIDNIYDDIESIYIKNKDAIRYNQNYFLSKEFEDKFTIPLLGAGILI